MRGLHRVGRPGESKLIHGDEADPGGEGIDVYDTGLAAMNVAQRMGPTDRPAISVDAIRV